MTAIKGEERPRSVVKIGAAGIAGKAGQRWEAGVGKGAAGEAARVSAGKPGRLSCSGAGAGLGGWFQWLSGKGVCPALWLS